MKRNWSKRLCCILAVQLFLQMPLQAVAQLDQQSLPWTLWDVSVLLPLPTQPSKLQLLLNSHDSGLGGPLIPDRVLSKMPALVGKLQNTDIFKNDLKVIAIRIDRTSWVQNFSFDRQSIQPSSL